MPPALECPGGSSAWEEVTTHGSSRLCQGQRNPCNSSGELGTAGGWGGAMSQALGAVGMAGGGGGPDPVTPCSAPPAWPCPENTACAPDGPGLVLCLCNSPFRGYKCLREVSACGVGPPSKCPPAGAMRAAWGGGATPLTAASSQGTFPVLLFCGTLGAVTVSLSLLLWGTQRRTAQAP